jgi:hypothetical protein
MMHIQHYNLVKGDLIFWQNSNDVTRAGHVAVIVTPNTEADGVRIAHATDSPKYMKFAKTYIKSSAAVADFKYFVIRINEEVIRGILDEVVEDFLSQDIPFNKVSEHLMNMWDDSMTAHSNETKLFLQNIMYNDLQTESFIPENGYMCSEAVVIAMQRSYILNGYDKSDIPHSLQFDPTLASPSLLMHALMQDAQNFEVMGYLEV